ncbi:hypothetical protein N7470_002240, partial [Penicillium chermesinum]
RGFRSRRVVISDPNCPPPPSASTVVGAALLRDYAFHIEPFQTHDIHPHDSALRPPGSGALPSQKIDYSSQEEAVRSLPSPTLQRLRQKSVSGHRPTTQRTLSVDRIPRQTIMKALASRGHGSIGGSAGPAANTNNQGVGVPAPSAWSDLVANQSNNQGSSQNPGPPEEKERRCSSASQKLSAALSSLQLGTYLDRSPATARLVMQSPCYFHQRFDDAVNIKKVLEEIADDEWLSHSRLVQTATGVREVSKQLQRRPIKRAVRNVMIVTKARDNSLVHLTRELAEWLLSTPRYGSEVGVNVYVDAKLRNSKRFDAAGLVQKDPRFAQMLQYWTPDLCWTSPDKFDLVLTLGGDGTVLFTSWLFQRVVPPVFCFSLGSLGFLTNFEFSEYKSHLNAVMGEVGMRVNLRMRFTCTVFRKDRSKGAEAGAVEEGEQFEVLNEVVIDRGPSPMPTAASSQHLLDRLLILCPLAALSCILLFRESFSLPSALILFHSARWSSRTPTCFALLCPMPPDQRPTGRVELRQGDYVTVEASQYPFPTVRGVVHQRPACSALEHTRGCSKGLGWQREEPEAQDAADEQWDIDTDAGLNGTDSGIGPSEDGDSVSPYSMRRQLSLLNM